MSLSRPEQPGITQDLVARLQRSSQHHNELPGYDYGSSRDLASIVTRGSAPSRFHLGTGASIYTSHLLPALLRAKSEVILVTCYWAKSRTLAALRECLEELAVRRRDVIHGESGGELQPLRVRICLSSTGLFQKLFHTASPEGHTYSARAWESELGLPSEAVLRSGRIDMVVKSLFFLPLSIVHPKFVIVDRQTAFMPSCNISWEPWLEACVEFGGPAIESLLGFYSRTWGDNLEDLGGSRHEEEIPATSTQQQQQQQQQQILSPASSSTPFASDSLTPTLLLPSSLHRNPHFHPFPWQSTPLPPCTPLNLATLQLLASAQRDIYIQTPNFTAAVVLIALLDALQRGCSVDIVTCERMMILEQLVTAGTTTARCVDSLVKRYKRLASASPPHVSLGRLRIRYYHPLNKNKPATRSSHDIEQGGRVDVDESEEPVQSHVKLTIVDEKVTILGSGNMDRPSWYTSQELGILFDDVRFAGMVRTAVDGVLEGRADVFYCSDKSVRE